MGRAHLKIGTNVCRGLVKRVPWPGSCPEPLPQCSFLRVGEGLAEMAALYSLLVASGVC